MAIETESKGREAPAKSEGEKKCDAGLAAFTQMEVCV